MAAYSAGWICWVTYASCAASAASAANTTTATPAPTADAASATASNALKPVLNAAVAASTSYAAGTDDAAVRAGCNSG